MKMQKNMQMKKILIVTIVYVAIAIKSLILSADVIATLTIYFVRKIISARAEHSDSFVSSNTSHQSQINSAPMAHEGEVTASYRVNVPSTHGPSAA